MPENGGSRCHGFRYWLSRIMVFIRSRQSGPDFHRDNLQPESRVPGEDRDPVFDMVPDFRRDDVWMPPYQVRGRLLKSGMTEKAVYGQTLNRSIRRGKYG